jgi:hypothetical protein
MSTSAGPNPASLAAEPRPVDWLDEEGIAPAEETISIPASVEGHRETTRSHLARWLMGLLTITVLTLLLLAGLQLAGIIGTTGISIADLAQIVLTPVVTLTGTALGFYFGAQSTSAGGSAPSGLPAAREPGLVRKTARWLW